MKRIILILTITLLSMTALPVLAQEVLPPDPTATGRFTAEPMGEYIIFDALVLRPMGLAAMAVGLAGASVVTPWAMSSQSTDRMEKELFQKPYDYTFCRPIGDIDF